MDTSKKHIISIAVALLALTGCGNDTATPDVDILKTAPIFSATIDNEPSRAHDTNWDTNDKIGVSNHMYTNTCFITEHADNRFAALTDDDQIYFHDGNETTFTAYYPWNETHTAIACNTKNQNEQRGFDFLWAQAVGKRDNPNVAIKFNHRMAKVVFNIKPGAGTFYDNARDAVLSLAGLAHEGAFNGVDGSTRLTASADYDDWTFSSQTPVTLSDGLVTYTMILLPQELEQPLHFAASIPDYDFYADIDFTSANAKADGAQAKNELVAGRQYNVSITLSRNSMIVDGCSISSWITINENEEANQTAYHKVTK